MSGSAIIDIFLGMLFIFLTVSMGVTAAQELIASVLKWKAKHLALGIQELLADPSGTMLAKEFYQHPLIRPLYRGDINKDRNKPSYISARTFAIALLDMAVPVGPDRPRTIAAMREYMLKDAARSTINQSVRETLMILLDQAENDLRTDISDVAKIQENIERWFNSSMDRVTGWYRRRTQAACFMLALGLVTVANVDAIRIVRTLSNDSVLRSSLIAQTTTLIERHNSLESEGTNDDSDSLKTYQTLQQNVSQLNQLGLALSWKSEMQIPRLFEQPGWWLSKVIGLILTTLAASLGAPFWFDLLKKFVALGTARKTIADTTSAESQKDGGGASNVK